MKKHINKTLALLMAFALCFSSVNIQAFAQIANDTEQAVVNTTEETTIEETAESEVLTESITEQDNNNPVSASRILHLIGSYMNQYISLIK